MSSKKLQVVDVMTPKLFEVVQQHKLDIKDEVIGWDLENDEEVFQSIKVQELILRILYVENIMIIKELNLDLTKRWICS